MLYPTHMLRLKNIITLVFLLTTGAHTSFASTDSLTLTQLHHLYPHLSRPEIKQKIAVTKNSFQFFRSFVSLYYQTLAKNPELTNELSTTLKSQWGWCAGDPHPENFGALLGDSGDAIFTINDFDDSTPCPLYSDFLRFLTSVLLYNPDVDLEKLVSVYAKTLSGKKVKLSQTTEDFLEKREEKGFFIANKDLEDDGELLRPDDALELNSVEQKTVEKIIQSKGLEFLDAYKFKRKEGGTFGTWRIRILAQSSKHSAWGKGQIQVELKQIQTPSTLPLTGSTPLLPAPQRLKTALEYILGKQNISEIYEIFEFNQKTFVLRPRWRGNKSISLEDLEEKHDDEEILKILRDQAEVLGAIHKKSARNIGTYLNAIQKTKAESLIQTAETLATQMRQYYKQAKKLIVSPPCSQLLEK